MLKVINICFPVLSFMMLLSNANCKTIGGSVKELTTCSKYDFEERILEKLVRIEYAIDLHEEKMKNWEIKIDKSLNKVTSEIDVKMKTFSENIIENTKRLENEELSRNTTFNNMLNKMSVTLSKEEQVIQDLATNFTADSNILFNNVKGNLSNILNDMDKNIKVKNAIVDDIVKKMNATVQGLVKETQIETDNQRKRANNVLQDLKSEFNAFAEKLTDGQKKINNSLISLTNDPIIENIIGSHGVKDCSDVKRRSGLWSGVYAIYPDTSHRIEVYCDMTTDNGGWTVIQRHSGTSVDFQRNWVDYENGFGDPHGDYWLGNKLMHKMTTKHKYELRIDLTDDKNELKYAVYKTFSIGDSPSKYQLTIGDYSGDAGEQLKYHNGMKFSTKDQDNDQHRSINCATAKYYYGPWWHKSCSHSALNKLYSTKLYWSGENVIKSVMMIRRL